MCGPSRATAPAHRLLVSVSGSVTRLMRGEAARCPPDWVRVVEQVVADADLHDAEPAVLLVAALERAVGRDGLVLRSSYTVYR
jgi:hypothetical protein